MVFAPWYSPHGARPMVSAPWCSPHGIRGQCKIVFSYLAKRWSRHIVWYIVLITYFFSYFSIRLYYIIFDIQTNIIDICTTQSISVLHNRSLYYTIDFCTTQSISVLHNRFLYYTTDTGVTQSISVWHNRFLHYIEVVCFGTKKLCTDSYIKTVVFELHNFTWLGIVLQGWFV